jgi:hypothetical protein
MTRLPAGGMPDWRGRTPRPQDRPVDQNQPGPDLEGIQFLRAEDLPGDGPPTDPDREVIRFLLPEKPSVDHLATGPVWEGVQFLRPEMGPSDGARNSSDPEGVRFLIGRSTDEPDGSRRDGRRRLRFNIQHIMYLTAWSAMLLAVREPLIASFPLVATVLIWASAIGAAAMIVAAYAIAWMMEEGSLKDGLVVRILYILCADMLLLFIFEILPIFISL